MRSPWINKQILSAGKVRIPKWAPKNGDRHGAGQRKHRRFVVSESTGNCLYSRCRRVRFRTRPTDARETPDGTVACAAHVEAALLRWFLPLWEIVVRHLLSIDRRLFAGLSIETILPSCDLYRLVVRWRHTSPPTDLQVTKVTTTVGRALHELSQTLRACQSTTPRMQLGDNNTLAHRVHQHLAATRLDFEPAIRVSVVGSNSPSDFIAMAKRQALPWTSTDHSDDKPILMKPGRIHQVGGTLSAALLDGTPFEGTFEDIDHLPLSLAVLAGHWIQVKGRFELDCKPLSPAHRMTGSITEVIAVSSAWHAGRLRAMQEVLDRLAAFPTFDPPARDMYAGTLFEGAAFPSDDD